MAGDLVSTLGSMAAKRAQRLAREQAEQAQRETLAAALDSEGPGGAAGDAQAMAYTFDMEESLKALQKQLDLCHSFDDVVDSEQVLFPATAAEPPLIVDPAFARSALQTLASCKVPDHGPMDEGDADESFEAAAFREAVLSGFVACKAAAEQSCSDATMEALFSLTAHSADLELSGAAFRTLLYVLGEPGATAATLDAGVPAFGLQPPPAGQQPVAVSPQAVPTLTSILQALKINGFDPLKESAAAQASATDAAAAAAQAGSQPEPEVAQGVRVQTVKLLLQLAAAVCGHCRRVAAGPAAAAVLEPTAVKELLVGALHLGIDPASLQLLPDIHHAAAALLNAVPDEDWRRRLPQLAERVAGLGPTPLARLRVLQIVLPADCPRAGELQLFSGCFLVERLLPSKAAKPSAVTSKRGEIADPAKVLQQQPWFKNPKALLSGVKSAAKAAELKEAAAAGSSAAASVYTMSDLEVLLQVCDMLLWPSALACIAARGEEQRVWPEEGEDEDEMVLEMQGVTGPILSSGRKRRGFFEAAEMEKTFHFAWRQFLSTLSRGIQSLQPEHQAVKNMALKMESQYTDAVLGNGGWDGRHGGADMDY